MIIEDDPDIRELLRELLEGEGFTVATANNGLEGLRKLEVEEINGTSPQLIFLDLMMPVMDGHGFMSAYRGSVPVVLVTAAGERLSPSFGAVETLRKPIEMEHLFSILERFGLTANR